MDPVSRPPEPGACDDLRLRLELTERLLACYQQVVGHELPNQLVAIQGMARLVEEDADRLDPDGRACLSRLAEMARRTQDFVKALADVGRAFRQAELPAEMPLEEVCREAAAEVNWLLPGRTIRYDINRPLPTLVLPPGGARRVVLELFLHAARRTPPEWPLRVEVRAARAGGVTEVHVRDDGPAPDPLGERQALDPFAAPAGDGPAFGLFLARLLAERWGGSLRLEPGEGSGCLATLAVPVIG